MADLTLRQQYGILVITVPDDVADRAGWTPGIRLIVTVEGETVSLTPVSRLPRGCKTLAHLLSGIDQSELSYLNEESHDGLNDARRAKNQSEGSACRIYLVFSRPGPDAYPEHIQSG